MKAIILYKYAICYEDIVHPVYIVICDKLDTQALTPFSNVLEHLIQVL
jgi:hypothetical protein